MKRDEIPKFSLAEQHNLEAVSARHAWASRISGVDLEALRASEDPNAYRGNVENVFGFVRIPVGLAGPLLLRGQHAQGEFLVPLATTEGTLVASYSRGMRAIYECGGARSAVIKSEITNSVTFVTGATERVAELERWIKANQDAIAEIVATRTEHGRFLRCEYLHFGSRLLVNFVYDPADAMGINMVTSITFAVCQMIARQHRGLTFYLPSALQGDKKATAYGFQRGRGRSVSAQVVLSKDVIENTLRSSAEGILAYHNNNVETAQLTGGLGFNMHIANGITALGLATGQDVAYVGESSNGQLVLEPHGSDLLVSLTIPSLYVGVVGGGTGLPTHKPCLEMLGCVGKGAALKLAEIFAGTCLGGEISVLAAIASNQFVGAHDRMGRNRPKTGPA